MKYLSVTDLAKKWNLSERTVRNYARMGRITGARLNGKTWEIPANVKKPKRLNKKEVLSPSLLEIVKDEKRTHQKGSIYHRIQIDLTYNSNHIEGSQLTHDQTRYIYETNTIGIGENSINVDDIMETANHFRCIDVIIEEANYQLSESLVKKLHQILKNGTSDSRKEWFAVGEYKKLPNEVGGKSTTSPENTAKKMKELLAQYNKVKTKTFEEIIAFHYEFESIHPFQDGNGRVGRLIMFKECLRNNMVPFIINEELKLFYYRGLKEWKTDKEYLMDTCLLAQDRFKKQLDYFRIEYQ
ncbi:Fic family protein [Enterococcus massiliensis]|uniref:Fic family protein n=1 Tax=Enterococcus massiliensis TaxID=1640685 RepID=UPI00065E3BF6|nr:Fic family protein [Enterococcus massiliensis]